MTSERSERIDDGRERRAKRGGRVEGSASRSEVLP
jgi:hypothetical protein